MQQPSIVRHCERSLTGRESRYRAIVGASIGPRSNTPAESRFRRTYPPWRRPTFQHQFPNRKNDVKADADRSAVGSADAWARTRHNIVLPLRAPLVHRHCDGAVPPRPIAPATVNTLRLCMCRTRRAHQWTDNTKTCITRRYSCWSREQLRRHRGRVTQKPSAGALF